MRLSTLAAIASVLLLTALPEPAHAASARFAAPSVPSLRTEARSVCHHLRWSSQRKCTSDKQLRFVTRPPLYYPSRYFADRPHYYYEQRRFNYWSAYPWYAHHRWYRWPYRYPYYW